jgi:hypothetical protein
MLIRITQLKMKVNKYMVTLGVNKYVVALLGIVAILLVYILAFAGNSDIVDNYAAEKHQIDSLSAEINILKKLQVTQDSIINRHRDSIIALDIVIEAKNQKIIDLRKYYNDKIKNAGSYTPTELDSFFTERYK